MKMTTLMAVEMRLKKRMMTTNRFPPIGWWWRLLVISSLFPFSVLAVENQQHLELSFSNGLVSILATDARVSDVVQEIAAKSNLRIVQHANLSGTISLELTQVSLSAALDEVLEDVSYQLFQSTPGHPVPGTLWIFSEGVAVDVTANLFFEAVIMHASVAEKKEAIRELRRLGTPDAVEILSLAVSDEDSRVRGPALEALAAIGSDAALAAIASATADVDPWVRGQAINALSSGDSETAKQYLEIAFTDPDPNVRLAVIEAFSDNPNDQTAAILSLALSDDDPAVRMFAAEALEDFDGRMDYEALMSRP